MIYALLCQFDGTKNLQSSEIKNQQACWFSK